MKKTLIIAITSLSIMSCQKEGYVYKANFMNKSKYYSGQDVSGSITTNFFNVDMNDSMYAANWYVKTDAYRDEIAKCDSFWVEYVCDVKDWNKR